MDSVCSTPDILINETPLTNTQCLDLRPSGTSMRNRRVRNSVPNLLPEPRQHNQMRKGALGLHPSSPLLQPVPTPNMSLLSGQPQVSVSLHCGKQSQTCERVGVECVRVWGWCLLQAALQFTRLPPPEPSTKHSCTAAVPAPAFLKVGEQLIVYKPWQGFGKSRPISGLN